MSLIYDLYSIYTVNMFLSILGFLWVFKRNGSTISMVGCHKLCYICVWLQKYLANLSEKYLCLESLCSFVWHRNLVCSHKICTSLGFVHKLLYKLRTQLHLNSYLIAFTFGSIVYFSSLFSVIYISKYVISI